MRGRLIVLEGIDRSGKSSQVKLLQQELVKQGDQVEVLNFPSKRPN